MMIRIRFLTVLLIAAALSPSLAKAEGVEAGTGSAKANVLLQAWSLYDQTATGPRLDERIRRAEVKFSGNLNDDWRWFVMFDPAKSLKSGAVSTSNDNKILQDIGIAWSFYRDFELNVGQFKIPTTAEGLAATADLIFPERSITARTGGDRREPGMMLTYKIADYKFYAMASNGQGTNIDDTNVAKDVSVRAEGKFFNYFKLGTFITLIDTSYSQKGSWGANLAFDYSAFHLDGETVYLKDTTALSTFTWVATGAYSLNDRFMPALRYESYRTGGVTGQGYSAGLNYMFVDSHAKLQLAYTLLKSMLGNLGSSSFASGINGNEVTLAFQVSI